MWVLCFGIEWCLGGTDRGFAGLTLALQNTKLVATAGLITGIAASFSMAASEYLSTKSEDPSKNALKSAAYTGIAYILTVLFLIFPFLTFPSLYFCLSLSLVNAVLVIFAFTFYVAIAQDVPFKRRFTEMLCLSFGVALLTFGLDFSSGNGLTSISNAQIPD